jgi:DNA-binding transcriptional MerR regulator
VDQDLLSIGDVAAQTGVATSALRYYDELGLLKPKLRNAGRRRYGPEAVAAVGVIVLLRQVGFTLAELKRLLSPRPDPTNSWREIATRKLDDLDAQIAKAQAARDAINHSLNCPTGDILACQTFWKTVEGVVSGHTVAEAHRH